MNRDGIAWSLDAVVAGVLSLFTVALVFSSASHHAFAQEQALRQDELQIASMNWSDAVVQLHDSNNPLFGAAHYSVEKRRVESRVLELALLEKAFAESRNGFLVARLSVEGRSFISLPVSGDCVAWNRFVLLHETGKRALLHGVVCRES